LAVLVAQPFDARFQLRLDALLPGQFAEDVLHIALTLLELLPVFVQVSRLLAAQQDVFPLLYLHLELQVGFIDQLRRVQRPLDQVGVALDTAGQKVKAGQRDQQHRNQTAAQQGENLRSQGLLQKHRTVLMTGMKHARFRRERSPDILVCGVGFWPKARNLPQARSACQSGSLGKSDHRPSNRLRHFVVTKTSSMLAMMRLK
jgi:hypothetical protein